MLHARHLAIVFLSVLPLGTARACEPSLRLETSRQVQIDASSGPIYGDITRYAREPSFLQPKEVVLTFDDGPSPRITRSVLTTLARFCVKATFFPVGRMALAHPDLIREIAKAGHTIGAHTWSHPYNLRRVDKVKVIEQIEKGFAAIALAADQPVAPFFRFPGLNDDGRALAHLQRRGIATFSVDVVSDDSYIGDVGKLVQTTLSRVSANGGGILLFHDIKLATAHALPRILKGLRKRGFKVVHLTSKFAFTPAGNHERAFKALLRKRTKPIVSVSVDGLHGTIRPLTPPRLKAAPPVTFLAPDRKLIELSAERDLRLQNLSKSITLRGWRRLVDEDTKSVQRKRPVVR